MKILQIATLVPYPPTDGGRLSVFGLIKSLSQKGHDIDFVCYQKNADYKLSYDALKQYCIPHILDVQTDNSAIGAFKNFFSKIPYNASKYYSNLMLNYLTDLLERKSFDIIQINHLHLGWLSKRLKKITDTPIVIRSQNIETIIMKRYSEQIRNPFLKLFSWIQYKKLLTYEPQIYSEFDLCIMISENDLRYLKMKNPEINAVYIPAGIEEDLISVKKRAVITHSIAHIGQTNWYPNYDSLNWFATEIFPKVLEKYPDATLYIYGGGNTKDFPVPKNVRKNVKNMGFVDNLWENLCQIEVTVVPLRIGGGIRIKILELLASGNLIVTTSIGKEGIDVKDEYHLLVADSSSVFAAKIIKVFDGYSFSEIVSNGREFILKNYLWNVIVDKFENSYKTIILKRN